MVEATTKKYYRFSVTRTAEGKKISHRQIKNWMNIDFHTDRETLLQVIAKHRESIALQGEKLGKCSVMKHNTFLWGPST